MSSSPARGLRWWLAFAGLLALVGFPWFYAAVSFEERFTQFVLVPFGALFQLVGLAYTATFLAILVHEGGHWLFGRLVGIRISDFVVGTGESPLRFTWCGIRFSFGPWLRWGYVCEIPERKNFSFAARLIFLSGGVVAVLLFVGALYLVPTQLNSADQFVQGFSHLRFFTFVSGGIGVWASVWPRLVSIEGRLVSNDALVIVNAWKNRGNADQRWQQFEWSNEVNALCRNGKYTEAAVILERMSQADQGNIALMDSLATLHALGENWERALATHHEIIRRTAPRSTERALAVDAAATLALQVGPRDELAKLRPLVEDALQACDTPTLAGTLGSILLELGETVAGVKLLNRCVKESDVPHDQAIANAYLAKAALQLGRKERAVELLGFAKAKCPEHPLVERLLKELEPGLVSSTEKIDFVRP